MKLSISFTIILIFIISNSLLFAQQPSVTSYPNTDLLLGKVSPANNDLSQLSAYYDLRNRHTYIQVTNFHNAPITIHVQIFQHDKNCDELNFFDDLTPNDTVIYDLENMVRNNGTEVPVNLDDDSYGYVVISDTGLEMNNRESIIGNFRIIDDAGYEYRTNMVSPHQDDDISLADDIITANFNTIDNARFADVVGYAYDGEETSTVRNIDEGFSFDIFVFDMNEEPLSCDRRNFACGNVMNYGVNEDYVASRGNQVVCPGGGLADPNGGYIVFENGSNLDGGDQDGDGTGDNADRDDMFVNFIGINNGDGTGSMDTWHYNNEFFRVGED